MKFARYLASHQIDEWHRKYIDYRALKKQIGRSEEELLELEAGNAENEDRSANPRKNAPKPREQPGHQSTSPSEDAGDAGPIDVDTPQDDLESGRGAESDDADDERARRVRRNGSYGADSAASSAAVKTASAIRPSPLRRNSALSSSSRERSDETTRTNTRLVSKPPADKVDKTIGRRTSTDKFRTGERFRSDDPTRRKWRFGLTPQDSLEDVLDKCPPQSRRFFKLLDRELDKVNAFWEDRQQEAIDRYDALGEQWKELADHKKEFQALRPREYHAPRVLKAVLPKHAHFLPGSNLVRRTLASRGHSPTDEGGHSSELEHHQRDGDRKTPEPTARQKAALRHGRPEEYSQARSKLKLATFEYYRFLGMLKSYRVLNRTGFAKAAKKFEKTTCIPCGAQYKPKVEDSVFVASSELDDLIRRTEDAFASVFEHGDRKRALERLRDFGEKKHHQFVSWRAGMLMGAGLPLMIEGLVKSFHADTRAAIPYWPALLQLFGACYLPVFFALAFFLNLATWQYGRINYVLIFELDVRSKLDPRQFLEIPAVLYFVLSLFFWAAFSNFWPNHISPSSYPLAWFVFAMVVLLNPLTIFYGSARWWMVRSMARVFSSGIVAVRFRDFFLGDELNSVYYSIYNLGFLYCTYSHGWPGNAQSICSTNKTWTSAVLASLPPFFRLGQSVRRYIDSDGLTLHMLNAGKYSATILYFWFYFNWRIDLTRNGTSDDWRYALFIVFATINSVYVSAWDILLDWSLGKRNKKHPWLRQELGYFKDNWWLYYVFAVLNVVLRFAWVLYLAPDPSPPVQSYIIALIEAARRIIWNTFRVEAEHIGNRDGYRVTRDVALPYLTASSPEATGGLGHDDDEDDPALPTTQRVFAAFHRLHASILQNLEPVIDVVVERTGWFRVAWAKTRRTKRRSDDEQAGEGEPEGQTGPQGRTSTTRGRSASKSEEREKRRRRRATLDGGESPSSGGEDDRSSDKADTIESPDDADEDHGVRLEEKRNGSRRTGSEGAGSDVGSQSLSERRGSARLRDLSSDEDEVEGPGVIDPEFAGGQAGEVNLKQEMEEVDRMTGAGKQD
ncbi:hypothetical protein JCM10212_002325 [Sporobolomyces blumeae]